MPGPGRPRRTTPQRRQVARRDSQSHRREVRLTMRCTMRPLSVIAIAVLACPANAEIRADGGTLVMQWGRTRVDMQVEVEPSLRITMDEADALPYLGEYTFTRNRRAGATVTSKFFVVYEQNTLKGYWEPDDAYYHHFALIRIAPDWFAPGVYDEQGRIYEVYRPDLTVEVKREEGRVMSLEIRMDNDFVWGTAKRVH